MVGAPMAEAPLPPSHNFEALSTKKHAYNMEPPLLKHLPTPLNIIVTVIFLGVIPLHKSFLVNFFLHLS